MTRTNATNFSGALQFPYATAGTDLFKKEDVQVLAQAVDQHNHTTGKGLVLPVSAIPPITSAMIADGGIATADLADGAVTSIKIADGTIALADLGPNCVDSSKIVDGSILTADLAAGACTGAALGPDVITTSNGAFAVWTDWSAAVTQGGSSPTYSTRVARSKLIGKVAFVNFLFNFSGVGSAGNAIVITTLPYTPRNLGYLAIGQFMFLHGGTFRSGVVFTSDGVGIQFLIDNNAGALGVTPSLAIASGDQLGGYLTYEAA